MADHNEDTLEPPRRTSMQDPGAHDLESESDDHFSDAHSARRESDGTSDGPSSPIPVTRVEKVDNEPSHGEVPGTDAYKMREEDARPDEVVILPDRKASRDLSAEGGDSPPTGRGRQPSTPGDMPIPTTVVQKVDSTPSHGEVPGTDAYEMRKQDAEPDVVEEVGDAPRSPTSSHPRSIPLSPSRRKSSTASRKPSLQQQENLDYDEALDGEEMGDDFDDFEEGEEDADFGDFDDGFQEPEAAVASPLPPQSIPIAHQHPSFPILDFSELKTPQEIISATSPHIDALFPSETFETSTDPPPAPSSNPVFLTPRSASLWAQLVAPPPLQPPNWIRSRIRRLFLVSLGVPVDLDEILPASKQKKLILPSSSLTRTSSDPSDRSRLRAPNDGSTKRSSSRSESAQSTRRRRGPPPPPELDLVEARQLCEITEEKMDGMTDEELKEHVAKLEKLEVVAKEVLEYWTKRTDGALGDREAFEGVIENLVMHARKVRK